jgi:hypothetical protein
MARDEGERLTDEFVASQARTRQRHRPLPSDPEGASARALERLHAGDPDGAMDELERSGLVVTPSGSPAAVERDVENERRRRGTKS